MSTRSDIIPGTIIELRFGPFMCTGEVMEVADVGIVVKPNDDASLVGYDEPMYAPNGRQLTNNVMHTFIGAAHLHEVVIRRHG